MARWLPDGPQIRVSWQQGLVHQFKGEWRDWGGGPPFMWLLTISSGPGRHIVDEPVAVIPQFRTGRRSCPGDEIATEQSPDG